MVVDWDRHRDGRAMWCGQSRCQKLVTKAKFFAHQKAFCPCFCPLPGSPLLPEQRLDFPVWQCRSPTPCFHGTHSLWCLGVHMGPLFLTPVCSPSLGPPRSPRLVGGPETCPWLLPVVTHAGPLSGMSVPPVYGDPAPHSSFQRLCTKDTFSLESAALPTP